MKDYLILNGIIEGSAIEKIADHTRDRADVSVWRCNTSGVIFTQCGLNDVQAYYVDKEIDDDTIYALTRTYGELVSTRAAGDDERRAKQFAELIQGKIWVDFGAGEGELVRLLAGLAKDAHAVEINRNQLSRMRSKNIPVLENWSQLTDHSLDVITLFHVFEHLDRPIELLGELSSKLKPGGTAVVEVPHAKDFLLSLLDCDAFKDFTFWSEHLILHTRFSLEAMLRKAGFSEVVVTGYQRYSLPNHLYWLRHGLPGGHDRWSSANTPELAASYAAMLNKIDQTDTLIAYCRV